MAPSGTAPSTEETAPETGQLTDGFHLVIDALKLNGITTIYGVPGIPITDLGRMAQAEGMRVISFRHEQNAGNAAAIAGYHATHGIVKHTMPSETWQTAFSIIGALAVGIVAFARIAS